MEIYQPKQELEQARAFIEKLWLNRFISFAQSIDEHQARSLLDPFPIDMVTSRMFFLREVKVSKLKPTGDRWVECSRSIGPILVDVNPVPDDYPEWGQCTVIEGKHRYLDAIQRGEDTILAWIGERAIDLMREELA